jgi:hypothetical protein
MNRRAVLSLLAAGSATLALPLSAAEKRKPLAPSWLTIDSRPPGLGVYLGAGCKGTERLKKFEAWLGRKVDQTLEFIGWNVLQGGTSWGVNCWNKAAQAVVYSLPMLPSKGSLRDAANGKYDELYRTYGGLLVNNGYGGFVIRLGWEFNANWYPWSATKDPQAWADAWRRIVTVLREIEGAKFQFDWCPAASARGFSADRAYPGDDFVDFVGIDFYNMPVDGKPQTPEQRWQTRMNMHHGLKWQRDFAQDHRKRMSIPEWGTGPHAKYGGAPDDAYFIEQMAAWMSDNKVAYHNYWEYKNKDLDTRLSNGSQPKAAAAFLKFFGANARAQLRDDARMIA